VTQDNKHFPTFNDIDSQSESGYIFQGKFSHAHSSMKFSTTLIGGKLVKRYRRFLVDVQLDSGPTVTAHCPNSGTMLGCSEPGRPVLLSQSKDPHRRNAYTWELIKMNDALVGINVSVPRKVLAESLRAKLIPSLKNYNDLLLDAEYGRGNKVDIMMHGIEQNVFINVHHVAWTENRIAKFPETANARARKGLKDLADIAAQGHKAIAFFFVQRSDCNSFSPAITVDPEFGKLFKEAQKQGVEMMVYRAKITPGEIALGIPIPCVVD
jgi:sugar fermentation stimulation protein A